MVGLLYDGGCFGDVFIFIDEVVFVIVDEFDVLLLLVLLELFFVFGFMFGLDFVYLVEFFFGGDWKGIQVIFVG